MASIGNIAKQLHLMTPAQGVTSLNFHVLFNCSQGAALALSFVTGIAELSAARVGAGVVSVMPGCYVVCLNSVAVAVRSALAYYNTGGTSSTITWAAVHSA